MLFGEKNDGGIELHMNSTERKLLYMAVRHFMSYGENEEYVIDHAPDICELLQVLEAAPEETGVE